MIETAGSHNADGTPGSRLVVRGLQKSYGSRKVVKDVSLDVQKGDDESERDIGRAPDALHA